MTLSVAVPCFEERLNFPLFETELFPSLDALGVDYEVLAVDDGSKDGSASELAKLASNHSRLRVLSHDKNRGLGAALRTAFAAAKGEWIVALDADMTFHPKQIQALIAVQKSTGADMVSGSPFLAPGASAGVPWARRLPSWMINAFYRGLLSPRLTAYTPIFRLYRSSALKSLILDSEGFEINAEIAARLLRAGFKAEEAPAELTERVAGVSKLARARELKRHLRLIWRLLTDRTNLLK